MARLQLGLAAAIAALCCAPALAQDQQINIGVIFDFTGPFAAGGSEAAALGTQIAIDMINEQGGVEGHMINPIVADAQSKAEVAIAEAEHGMVEVGRTAGEIFGIGGTLEEGECAAGTKLDPVGGIQGHVGLSERIIFALFSSLRQVPRSG